MRTIDADALIAKLKEEMNEMNDGIAMIYTQAAINELKHAPTVDAVQVIRCRDCKNSEHWYRDRRRCFLWNGDGVSVFDSGFCNYAERRTDE